MSHLSECFFNKKRPAVFLFFAAIILIVGLAGLIIFQRESGEETHAKVSVAAISETDFIMPATEYNYRDVETTFTPPGGFTGSVNNTWTITSPVDDFIVAQWPMDQSITDITGNGHNGVVGSPAPNYKSPVTGECYNGGCWKFDSGEYDYLYIPHSSDFNVGSEMTLSFWYYPLFNFDEKSGGGWTGIVMKGNFDATPFWGIYQRADNPFLMGVCDSTNSKYAEANLVRIEANNWYHVALVCDYSSVSVYINGELSGHRDVDGDVVSNSYSIIWGRNRTKYYEWNFGYIDDALLASRAFSSNQIESMYENGLAGNHDLSVISFTETAVGETWQLNAIEELYDGSLQPAITVGTVDIVAGAGAVCGNNILEQGEVCEDGNASDAGICNADCSAFTNCGDGVTQNPNGDGVAEVCDDGGNNGQPGMCTYQCDGTIPVGYAQTGYGDGSDGELIVSAANTVVNSYTYLVTNYTAGTTVVEFYSADAFAVGDEVLILQTQNNNQDNVGIYEYAKIKSKASDIVTLNAPLRNNYYSTLVSIPVRTQVIRVPQYTNVTVESGASLTSSAWNGWAGGVLVFRASGNITVEGDITAEAKGYRGGGKGVYPNYRDAYPGESYQGQAGSRTYLANYGAGGGGDGDSGGCGGMGGAGGSHATSGYRGSYESCVGARRAVPGTVYGYNDLSRIFMGSGGGGGGTDDTDGNDGGDGGNGGGIIMIYGSSINLTGTISANGEKGDNSEGAVGGSGGGGAGGSVYLTAHTMNIHTSLVTAEGGDFNYANKDGGEGGDGIIRLDHIILNGTTSPSSYKAVASGENMPTGVRMASTVYLDGKIYVIGGMPSNSWDMINKVQIFDIASQTWENNGTDDDIVIGGTPYYRSHAGAVVYDGKIYLVMGLNRDWDSVNTMLIYDPDAAAGSRWSKSDAVLAQTDSRQQGAVVEHEGIIYYLGGVFSDDSEGIYVTENDMIAYDIENDVWLTDNPYTNTAFPTLPVVERGQQTAQVINGKIYMTAGRDDNWDAVTRTDAYDIAANTWTTGLSAIPTGRQSAGSFVYKGRLYVLGGGLIGPDSKTTVEVYNPGEDAWETEQSLDDARIGAGCITYPPDFEYYCVGGGPGGGVSYETFETHPLMSRSITVTSTADSNSRDGAITLREALSIANGSLAYGTLDATEQSLVSSNVGSGVAEKINFDISGAGPHTFMPVATYEALADTQPVFIDGYTQSGAVKNSNETGALNSTLKIEIDGSNFSPANASVMAMTSSAHIIQGLVLNKSKGTGYGINGWNTPDNVWVQGCYIGTDTAGAIAKPNSLNGVGTPGVYWMIGVDGDGFDDASERNLISGNTAHGVQVNSNYATIAGNIIGLNKSGAGALGNGNNGVSIENAAYIRVGSNGDGVSDIIERNVISANNQGIYLHGDSSDNNIIAGNYIGTDVTGNIDLGNTTKGIYFYDQADNNTIGTDGTGSSVHNSARRNVISGNGSNSSWGDSNILFLSNCENNMIAGNIIGLGADGDTALDTGGVGIYIHSSNDNVIGTNGDGVGDAYEKNIVSGNGDVGIFVYNSAEIVVAGNYIGLDETGLLNKGNLADGLAFNSDTVAFYNSRVGTNGDGASDELERNYIAGNGGTFYMENSVGIGSPSTGDVVAGNYFGTDITGNVAIPNGAAIYFGCYMQGTIFGYDGVGDAEVERNVVAASGEHGLYFYGCDDDDFSMQVQVSGNYIGVGADGTTPLGNDLGGIFISFWANDNIIGGTSTTLGNIIANNGGPGVVLVGGTGPDGDYTNTYGNKISHNSFYNNTGLSIDISDDQINYEGDGPTANDTGDTDDEINKGLNYPVIETVYEVGAGQLEVTGTLDIDTDPTTATIEFYEADDDEDTGYGEGKTFISSITGAASFTTILVTDATVITALTIDAEGNTSEFSANKEAEERHTSLRVLTPSLPGTPIVETISPTSVVYYWDDTSNNEEGFRILDNNSVLIETASGMTQAREEGLLPNTLYTNRGIYSYNSQSQSGVEKFNDFVTLMPQYSPVLLDRTGSQITLGVDQPLYNLSEGQTALYFEYFVPATNKYDEKIYSSDWTKTETYTFSDIPESSVGSVRVKARNQIGVETDWSKFFTEDELTNKELSTSLIVELVDTAVASDLIPNTGQKLNVKFNVNNNSGENKTNVVGNLIMPKYLYYNLGTLRVDSYSQTDIIDGDFANANNNGITAIKNLPAKTGFSVQFELLFDKPAIKEYRMKEIGIWGQPIQLRREILINRIERVNIVEDLNELIKDQYLMRLREVSASALPVINVQGYATSDQDETPVYSNNVTLNVDITDIDEEIVNDVIEGRTEEQQSPSNNVFTPPPVEHPTVEETEVIDEIILDLIEQELDEGGDQLSVSESNDKPKSTTTFSSDDNSFNVEVTNEDGKSLSFSGYVQVVENRIEFYGSSSEPYSAVSLTLDNNITLITKTDENGDWFTYIEAAQLGLKEGETRTLTVEGIIAQKGLKSSKVKIGEVEVTYNKEMGIKANFKKVFTDSVSITVFKILQKDLVEFIEKEEPQVRQALAVTAPVIVISSAPLWGYLPYIPTLIYHFITYILGFLGRRKRRERYYGVVYDAITKEPVSLAVVRIYSATPSSDRKLITTVVTDKHGRYEALLAAGEYVLEVKRPPYRFPSQIVKGKNDGEYNVYEQSRPFTVSETRLLPDVPLDPLNFKQEWTLANVIKKAWMALQRVGQYMAVPVLFVGAFASLMVVTVVPENPLNWLLAVIYIALLLLQIGLRIKRGKEWGLVYEAAGKQVLPLTTIRLIEPEYGKVLKSRLSDYEGRYAFSAEPGEYIITASKEGYADKQTKAAVKKNEQINVDMELEKKA